MPQPALSQLPPPAPHTRRGRPFNTTTKMGKIMLARRWRVRDVANATGIAERALSDFLAGTRLPSTQTMHKLIVAFGVQSADDLF